MRQRHNHKKGFSLIEAAIVLGVVGLVVAGIWVAASAVSENYRISQATKGVLSIVQNTRNLFNRNWPSYNINLAQDSGSIPPIGFTMGLFNGASGFSYNGQDTIDPFGNDGFYIELNYDNTPPIPDDLIGIWFSNSNINRCIKLVSAISSRFHDTSDLVAIYLPGTGWMIIHFPFIPTATQCTAGSHWLGFLFSR